MKIILGLMLAALLAGCGADGAPLTPTAGVGISVGPGGVSLNCSVGGTNGTVTVSVAC